MILITAADEIHYFCESALKQAFSIIISHSCPLRTLSESCFLEADVAAKKNSCGFPLAFHTVPNGFRVFVVRKVQSKSWSLIGVSTGYWKFIENSPGVGGHDRAINIGALLTFFYLYLLSCLVLF